jgi:hypothetical protein
MIHLLIALPVNLCMVPERDKPVLDYRHGRKGRARLAEGHRRAIEFVAWTAGFIVAGFAVGLLLWAARGFR